MKNIGSTRYGGSIHAAQFIQRFIKKNTPWAHLDIAGVSWTMKVVKILFIKFTFTWSHSFWSKIN